MPEPSLAQQNVVLIKYAEMFILVGAVVFALLVCLFGFSARAVFGGSMMGVVLAFVWPILWKRNWWVLNILIAIPVIVAANRINAVEGNEGFQFFPVMLLMTGLLWFLNKRRLSRWLEGAR